MVYGNIDLCEVYEDYTGDLFFFIARFYKLS